jgi:hypothetical protein
MIRVSRDELRERWAMTYREDGYQVRAANVIGLALPRRINAATPDIEAQKHRDRVLVRIIESQEALDAVDTRRDLQALGAARGDGTSLHVIVAAECLSGFKEKMDDWDVHPDQVHVT